MIKCKKISKKKKTLFTFILKKSLEEIRSLLKANKSQSQEILIEKLSGLIRQWWSFLNSPPLLNCFISRPFRPLILPYTSLKSYACVFFSYSFYFPLLKNRKVRFVENENKKEPWFSELETSLFVFPKSVFYRTKTSFIHFFLEPSLLILIFLKKAPFFLNSPLIIRRKKNKGNIYPFLKLERGFRKKFIQLKSNSLKLKNGIKRKVVYKKKKRKNQWEVLLAPDYFNNELKWLNVLYVLPTGLLFFLFFATTPSNFV